MCPQLLCYLAYLSCLLSLRYLHSFMYLYLLFVCYANPDYRILLLTLFTVPIISSAHYNSLINYFPLPPFPIVSHPHLACLVLRATSEFLYTYPYSRQPLQIEDTKTVEKTIRDPTPMIKSSPRYQIPFFLQLISLMWTQGYFYP